MLGILGGYLGRVYKEVQNRPLYAVALRAPATRPPASGSRRDDTRVDAAGTRSSGRGRAGRFALVGVVNTTIDFVGFGLLAAVGATAAARELPLDLGGPGVRLRRPPHVLVPVRAAVAARRRCRSS